MGAQRAVAERELADLKFQAGYIRQKISHTRGGFRQPAGYKCIALALVAPQNILGIKGRAVIDFQLALTPASRGADALGGKSRAAARLIRFLEQQHARAPLGCHERRYQPASAGADDDDVALYVLHGASDNTVSTENF